MNKLIIISLVVSVVLIASCGGDKTNAEKIKKQIAKYESEIIEIKGKIALLENQLDTMNLSKNEGKILVNYMEAKSETFINYIDVVGSVVSENQSIISPEINGLIEKIYVKEGDFVTQGKILVSLKTDVSDRSIREVETSLELAKTVYKKQKDLWEQKIGSEIQYLQAKNNKESLEMRLETLKAQVKMAYITAPFDGYVETIYQKPGEIASPGRQVIELVNLSVVKVEADVSESYISSIQTGDTALVSFPSLSGYQLVAPISMTGSIINPNNRTFKVQVNLKNKDNKLKPNLITNIKLVETVVDSTFVVPSIIVKNDAQGNKYLYLASQRNGQLVAEKRFVKIGMSYGNKTQIISGLKQGDLIINQGYNTVKNGSIIRIK